MCHAYRMDTQELLEALSDPASVVARKTAWIDAQVAQLEHFLIGLGNAREEIEKLKAQMREMLTNAILEDARRSLDQLISELQNSTMN